MHLNTRIKLPDGRMGTICYHNLDGYGGMWGEHTFRMPINGFGDELPYPDFMLRDKDMEGRVGGECGKASTAECVGEKFEIIFSP